MPPRQSPLNRLVGRAGSPADQEAARADGAIDRATMRDNPWDPSAVNRSLGCLELASRKPSWPAINRSHSTGRTYGCKRSDLTKKLLRHGGRPRMGPGSRPGRRVDHDLRAPVRLPYSNQNTFREAKLGK